MYTAVVAAQTTFLASQGLLRDQRGIHYNNDVVI
jgi:hypothetical protein